MCLLAVGVVTSVCIGGILLVRRSRQGHAYVDSTRTTAAQTIAPHAHEEKEKHDSRTKLKRIGADVRRRIIPELRIRVLGLRGQTDKEFRTTIENKRVESSSKTTTIRTTRRRNILIHFVRHGEGEHNLAQRKWRENPSWDGVSEPYTLETDPTFVYLDPSLTSAGREQALTLRTDIRKRNMSPDETSPIRPQVLFLSPLRRATQTGLAAFEDLLLSSGGPIREILANELLHETSGKHTCDKRRSRTDLSKEFPRVSYELVKSEEDPFWGDGRTREPWTGVAERAARFLAWLVRHRSEREVAVAAHSGFLAAMFVAVLDQDDGWFRTGEMRSVRLAVDDEAVITGN